AMQDVSTMSSIIVDQSIILLKWSSRDDQDVSTMSSIIVDQFPVHNHETSK
ncbi:hypothetical protein A2U01_0080146, partial [Trifolium medium]|nr:hypothetical protein [Trifolium medium]